MKHIKIFLLGIFLFNMTPSYAWWGMNGHRIVGEIADNYLSKKAKRAIKEILGNESVAMSSNWADFIKSDSTFDHLNPWHYLNQKAGLTFNEMQQRLVSDTGANLYNKINFCIEELKNKNLQADKKVMYLKLLIHFIGDLHQPMHVGGRPEDLGGNRVRVLWFNEPTNLHSVWDDKLIEHQKLSYTEYAKVINHASKNQRKEWQKMPMIQWYWEGYQISQEIYAGIKQPDQKLSYDYNFTHLHTVNQQLLKGGIRLAGVLNMLFG